MHTPRRVVSLSPNVSVMLFALGADEVVVGRTQDCLPALQHYLRVWRIPERTVAQRLQRRRRTVGEVESTSVTSTVSRNPPWEQFSQRPFSFVLDIRVLSVPLATVNVGKATMDHRSFRTLRGLA